MYLNGSLINDNMVRKNNTTRQNPCSVRIVRLVELLILVVVKLVVVLVHRLSQLHTHG